METDEQKILTKVNTLLALERNFLAEERTALAELRTGITLALLGPPASTIVAYILSLFPVEIVFFDVLNIAFFVILTILGIWMSLLSRSKLQRINRKKKLLKAHKATIVKNSKVAHDLLSDFLDTDDQQRMDTRRQPISLRLESILRQIFRIRKKQS